MSKLCQACQPVRWWTKGRRERIHRKMAHQKSRKIRIQVANQMWSMTISIMLRMPCFLYWQQPITGNRVHFLRSLNSFYWHRSIKSFVICQLHLYIFNRSLNHNLHLKVSYKMNKLILKFNKSINQSSTKSKTKTFRTPTTRNSIIKS